MRIETNFDNVPNYICIKGGFNENSKLNRAALVQECLFYAWSTDKDLQFIPQCYYATIDDAGQGIVIMEDLVHSNADFFDPIVGLTPTQVANQLAALADLHSRTLLAGSIEWAGERGGTLRADKVGKRLMSEESWNNALHRPRATSLPEQLRDRATILDWMRASYRANYLNAEECLLHGDPHPGNMFCRDVGGTGFYDWQRSMKGPCIHDVAYLIAGSLAVDDRRNCENDLLNHYLDLRERLAAPAVPYDDFFTAYRREVIQPLLWFVTPEGTQPEDIIGSMVHRFSAAIIDLDAKSLLKRMA